MSITATARGTGGNNTGSTSIVCSPTSTIPAGSGGCLVIAADNAGGSGAAQLPASQVDSVGNTWTRRINPTYDPGAASAGVETAYYTCDVLTTALTSGNNITFSGLNSVTAKAYVFWEATPDAGFIIQYVTGAAGTGAASGTPTVTTSSITSGDLVIGGGGAESADTWAQDGDTSNGSWSAHQHTGFGTGTSGISITSQTKVVTGTATQTYNPTLTSADQILGWIQLTQVSSGHPAVRRWGGIAHMGIGGLQTGRGW
jgi:hypothetical protein